MENNGTITQVPFEQLRPGQFQPRTIFDKKSLDELATSIQKVGIKQPLSVRPLPFPTGLERYEIVAGERRWRAAQFLGLTLIPVYIKEMSDEEAAISAMAENVSRSNLNPIDEANGLQRLMDEFGYSLQETAAYVGTSKSHVSNMLRLLRLPKKIQLLIKNGALKKTHAKMLVCLPEHDQERWGIKAQAMSTHAFEKALKQEKNASKKKTKPLTEDTNIKKLELDFSNYIGSPTKLINKQDQKCILQISCDNYDILDGILIKVGFKKGGGIDY
jgi:ParB family chromosome partitioning protein